jgi:hypothetical protein
VLTDGLSDFDTDGLTEGDKETETEGLADTETEGEADFDTEGETEGEADGDIVRAIALYLLVNAFTYQYVPSEIISTLSPTTATLSVKVIVEAA